MTNHKLILFKQTNEHYDHLLISFSIFGVLTVLRIFGVYGDKNPLKRFKTIFSATSFLVGLAFVISWSLFILLFGGAKYFTKDPELYNFYIEATKKAVLAIIIAVFAKLELIIPVFWFVWLMAFYFQSWS